MTETALGITVVVFSLAACGISDDLEDQRSEGQPIADAEAFIDAFYSFESERLLAVLVSADGSIPSILFYQGWAEGGNYKVAKRRPCLAGQDGTISCSITVKDDLIGALGIDFNVTDTFSLTFSDGEIVSVITSSNDPQEYYDAQAWVEQNRPELIDEQCRGFFDGGATPGDCVRAMVEGYSEYAASGSVLDIDKTIN